MFIEEYGLNIADCFTLVSCLAYSSTLKIKATYSYEMSVGFQRSTRHFVTEDKILPNHCCQNFKFYMSIILFSLGEMDSLPICPHVTIRKKWKRVLWTLISEIFIKICGHFPSVVKI
jgi:hypothetical protein